MKANLKESAGLVGGAALALLPMVSFADVPTGISAAITGMQTDLVSVAGMLAVAGVAVWAGIAIYRKFFRV